MSSKYEVSGSASSQLNIVEPPEKYSGPAKQSKKLKWALVACCLLAIGLLVGVIVLATRLVEEIDKNEASAIVGTTSATSPSPEPSTATSPGPPNIKEDIFLPKALKPHLYQIRIKPNMYEGPAENLTFEGSVTIEMMCLVETDNVTLHTESLTIDESSVKVEALTITDSIQFTEISRDNVREFTIFHLDKYLSAGENYSISMNFTGPLKKDGRGFYRSDYVEDNRTRYTASTQFAATGTRKAFPCFDEPELKAQFDVEIIRHKDDIALANMNKINTQSMYSASTQFQPTDARKAFPCFDEPDLRAQFEVKIVRPTNYTALSNEIRNGTELLDGDFVIDTFDRTVVMPTYLVAFFVGEFRSLTNLTDKNVLVRTWARRDMYEKTDFALSVAVDITEYFEEYTKTNYTLPKQDHVGVSYFSAGAMENWGLIKYREEYLTFRPEDDNQWRLFFVALIVDHELAHMWFGNLVTCKWWNDIWLNEGFASYFETIGMHFTHPDWSPYALRVSDVIQNSMSADGFPSSRAVVAEAYTNEEIENMFDVFTYDKASCMVEMIEFILGTEGFQRALKSYLDKNAYGSVETQDLWDALDEEISGTGEKMDKWLRQNNYPVVTVERDNGTLILTQKRFLEHPSLYNETDTAMYGHRWDIPFTFTTHLDAEFDKQKDTIVWFYATNESLTIMNSSIIGDGWIIANPGVRGYYRVNYDNATWYQLRDLLVTNHTIVHARNRAQLLSDAWTLAQAGMLEIEIPIELSLYIGKEEMYMPWSTLDREFAFIERMFRFSKHLGAMQAFVLSKTTEVLSKMGYVNSGSTFLDINLRSLLMSWNCDVGGEECISNVTGVFKEWTTSGKSVDPDIRYTTYCTAIRHGGEAEWNWLYDKYTETDYSTERDRIIWGLTCTREPWMISRYIDILLNEEYFESSDREYALIYLSRNPVGRSLVYETVLTNWNDLMKKTGFSLSFILSGITDSFNTEADKAKILAILNSNLELENTRSILENILSVIDSRIEWMRDYGDPIGNLLSKKMGLGSFSRVVTGDRLRELPRRLEPALHTLKMPGTKQKDRNRYKTKYYHWI